MTGPPTGWRVELTLDSGETITPTVAAEPTYYHSLNSLPEADIPVRPDDALLTGTADRVDARVYADGRRLPLDTVTEIEQRRGGGELVLILTVIGGTQLQTRAARELASKPAHTVVEDLVTAETPYATSVDAPALAGATGQILYSASDAVTLREEVFGAAGDSDLYSIDDGTGELTPRQSAFLAVAKDDFTGTGDVISDSDAEQDEALDLDTVSETIEVSVGPSDHDIPESEYQVAVRARLGSSVSFDSPADATLNVDINGTTEGGLDATTFGPSYAWYKTALSTDQPAGNTINIDLSINPAADSGTFVDTPTSNNDGVVIDAVAVYDDRATHMFDNTADPYLDGPGPFGERPVVGKTELADESLSSLTGTVTVDTPINFQLGVSGDGGASFTTASTTDTVTANFSPAVDRGTLRVTLSGHGSQNQSPSGRDTPHAITTAELTADTTGTPLLSNETFDDNVVDILREIARKVGAIWEVQFDSATGQQEVNWTWPGQRSAGRDDLDASAVQLQRDSTALTEAVTVVGGRRRREVVTDSAQFSAAFRVEITDTNSAVAEGQTLEVDYRLENIGPKSGSTDVELVIDGTVEDTDSGVSLASDGETTGTLQWPTSAGDAGTYTATVRCADEKDQQAVTVTEPPEFDVTIDSVTGAPGGRPADVNFEITLSETATNSPVTAGEDLLVSPLVDNVDTQEAGTLVTLEQVGGPVLDSQYIQTDGSQSPTLTWSTSAGDAGTYLLRVRAGFASETVTVTVTGVSAPSIADNAWLFSEGSGDIAADTVGSFDADFGSAISWASDGDGKGGTYGILDGSGGADLGSASLSHWSHWVNSGVGAFGMWINPDTTSERNELLRHDGGVSNERSINLYRSDTGIVHFDVGTSSGVGDVIKMDSGPTTVAADEWTAVAVRANGSSAAMYINGIEVATDTVSTTESGDLQSDNGLRIGDDHGLTGVENPWDGGIDDFWSDQSDPGEQAIKDWYSDTEGNYQ